MDKKRLKLKEKLCEFGNKLKTESDESDTDEGKKFVPMKIVQKIHKISKKLIKEEKNSRRGKRKDFLSVENKFSVGGVLNSCLFEDHNNQNNSDFEDSESEREISTDETETETEFKCIKELYSNSSDVDFDLNEKVNGRKILKNIKMKGKHDLWWKSKVREKENIKYENEPDNSLSIMQKLFVKNEIGYSESSDGDHCEPENLIQLRDQMRREIPKEISSEIKILEKFGQRLKEKSDKVHRVNIYLPLS